MLTTPSSNTHSGVPSTSANTSPGLSGVTSALTQTLLPEEFSPWSSISSQAVTAPKLGDGVPTGTQVGLLGAKQSLLCPHRVKTAPPPLDGLG